MTRKAKLLVAHYNDNSYLNFVNQIKSKYDVVIYDKSRSIESEDFDVVHMQNIGREAYAYIKYIIDNYENLSDFNIFIQDDIDNHVHNKNDFIKFCDDHIKNGKDFGLYPCRYRKGGSGPIIKRTIKNGINCRGMKELPARDSVKLFCEKFNISLPDIYSTWTCAHFIVSRKRILKHKKEFYSSILDWLPSHNKNDFILEHVWHLIFR